MKWVRRTDTSAELTDTPDGLAAHVILGDISPTPATHKDRWYWHLFLPHHRDFFAKNSPLITPQMHATGNEAQLWLAIEAVNRVLTAFGYEEPKDETTD